jgi:phospholipid/cholesterol/gamma-HCH transport system ATP-binding protein
MTLQDAETTAKIRIRDLHKSFGEKQVLAGIDLDVAEGESLVVIGGSGTGKSVLLKCILGIMQPDRGSIEIDGQEVTGLGRRAREQVMQKFGMLFQGAALFDSLPVWENVAFGLLQVKKLGRTEARTRAVETLARVGLGPDVADLSPAELSGGMQKRVGLARAIATQPEILFFDEPTTGLDPIMADVINELIARSVRQLGATAISITHDLASARKIADRIAMLYRGKIVWQGPVGQIDDSGNAFVDQFIHGRAEGPIELDVRAALTQQQLHPGTYVPGSRSATPTQTAVPRVS